MCRSNGCPDLFRTTSAIGESFGFDPFVPQVGLKRLKPGSKCLQVLGPSSATDFSTCSSLVMGSYHSPASGTTGGPRVGGIAQQNARGGLLAQATKKAGQCPPSYAGSLIGSVWSGPAAICCSSLSGLFAPARFSRDRQYIRDLPRAPNLRPARAFALPHFRNAKRFRLAAKCLSQIRLPCSETQQRTCRYGGPARSRS
jgi:hypothetical protein